MRNEIKQSNSDLSTSQQHSTVGFSHDKAEPRLCEGSEPDFNSIEFAAERMKIGRNMGVSNESLIAMTARFLRTGYYRDMNKLFNV